MSQTINSSVLPQPTSSTTNKVYTYIHHEEINSTYFPSHMPIPPQTPCRFLLSKGKDGRKTQLSPDTVVTVNTDTDTDTDTGTDNHTDDFNTKKNNNNSKDRRVKIQYPKGSTYHIRRSNLIPILHPSSIIVSPPNTTNHMVVLVPETEDYRRLCITHTRTQLDTFIEIGSDLGKTIGVVHAKYKLGIDKSKTSIETSRRDYPNMEFREEDVLTMGNTREVWQELLHDGFQHQCNNNVDEMEEALKEDNLVVGIDINGNRELEAVRDCLTRVLEWWSPRLVLVKSRSLFQAFLEIENKK